MNSIEELSQEFYTWEKRCRGWEVYGFPVDMEPPFEPFIFHSNGSAKPTAYIDDGVRPTLVSRFITSLKNKFSVQPEAQKSLKTEEEPLEPFQFDDLDEPLTALSISLPKDFKIRPDEMERLLLMFSISPLPMSFEIIGNSKSVRIQFVCRAPDVFYIHDQIKAFFPQGNIQEECLEDIIPEEQMGYIVDFGLKEEFMRPLSFPKSYDHDPLIGLFGILENLQLGEQAAIQILFQGAQNAWSESIIRSVTDNNGESFFLNAPEMVFLAKDKVSSPLFGVVIRAMAFNNAGNPSLITRITHALVKITESSSNKLIPLSAKGYDDKTFLEDVYFRQSHRLGMLLNCKELANLVHFPSASVYSKKLKRDTRKTKEAPEIFLGQKLVLGLNSHQGKGCEVSISGAQRLKHIHVIGATGTGKSTLLQSMIIQDILNGEGLAVIDPHGDLIESVLPYIPKERHCDVILLDPSDSEYPVGLNILTAHSEIEKDILSSDLVAIFKRLSTSWGDQMNSVFANAILAFLESQAGGTLIDLRRFLIEKDFRTTFLQTINDPSIVYYWTKEFPLLKSTSVGPILTRLDAFLRPKVIRNMVAQRKSLDFEEILEKKMILLIKLSQGLIGEENSYLFGAFMVSKLQQAAMSRQSKAKSERTNYYLYVDEFQNFITPSMSTILSGARKYHLGLVLAHQDMQQLVKNDSELASSVISNAGTRICFRVGDTDARKFESNFSTFDAFDLQNLETGQAIIRVERPENDCSLDTIQIAEMASSIGSENIVEVISASRSSYATPKLEVENWLRSFTDISEHSIGNQAETIDIPVPLPKPRPQPIIQAEMPVISEVSLKNKKQETQHRYLQTLIKKMAESRGFKASIEKPTPSGNGRIDVVLERNGKRIAVEIKDTTDDKWELGNIEKCLTAGYQTVIECSTDPKTIDRLRRKVESEFEVTQKSKIQVLNPEDIFLLLDTEIAKEASNETRMKGYRVKVEYNAIPESEMLRKKETIVKSVVKSLKDMKK